MSIVSDIQRQFWFQHNKRFELMAPNIFTRDGRTEMDLFAVRKSGFCDEVEIKITVSDFRADAKKTAVTFQSDEPEIVNKYEGLTSGLLMPNYFSFILPANIAEVVRKDVPEFAGLYVYYVNRLGRPHICCEKSPPRLHRRKINEQRKYEIVRGLHFRYWQQFYRSKNG